MPSRSTLLVVLAALVCGAGAVALILSTDSSGCPAARRWPPSR
ncbi:MAG TPA: hypothetical protein VKB28_18850 [Solirubrobacteraceae bacterium]|nr:hypothetical protein [Solirubrobacteraceae bacterium]